MRLTVRAAAGLLKWGEHDHPLPGSIVAELVARGLVRTLHLKSEESPINMLTTAGFEMRDRLRAEWAARQVERAGP
jgi:hypothetical protein